MPDSYARAYMGKVDCVTLQGGNGKRWLVNCNTSESRPAVRLRGGWIEFAMANNLKEGDVCVFELIQQKDLVFKVTIFAS